MFKFFVQIWESLRFAMQALSSNLLRTLLSLLGVTIGIFAIISVLTIVDSLERNIRSTFDFIGNDVMFLQKRPFIFVDPRDFPFWKYEARPVNTYNEYKFLEENVKNAAGIAMVSARGGTTVKYKGASISEISVTGGTFGYNRVVTFEIAQGRYFQQHEVENARNVILIGHDVAEKLFTNEDPLGKNVKIKGRSFTVIGVLRREGVNLFGQSSFDKRVIIPFLSFTKIFKVGKNGLEPSVAFKGLPTDKGLFELEGEIKGLIRAKRGLKPTEEDNFALNRTELFLNLLGSLFAVISIAGWVIGSFSILVGGFGIANIMFVSVKERTSIIGIQKSLGAKNYFILAQFLFEAVFLSLIGGLVGLGLVYLITFIPLGSLTLSLTTKNIATALGISSFVGILSGIVPAYSASRMNPVEAIRAK
jgi:putative ABC transport system permease protein